jgi:acetyltransferase-like isoleucine patch superfamily enzyme
MSYPAFTLMRDGLALIATRIRRLYFKYFWKMDIGVDTRISLSAKLDKTNPRGVHIGSHTLLAFGSAIITHDFVNRRHCDVWIGDNCFIGAYAIVLPGVRIGDNCVVGAASVVTRDVPDGSWVVGNPARVIRSNMQMGRWGRFDRAPARESYASKLTRVLKGKSESDSPKEAK